MTSPTNAHRLRTALIAFSFAALLLAMAVVMVPTPAKAATHSKDVRGYAYDAEYRKIEGAMVTVTMFISENNPRTIKSEPTSAIGFFNIQFLDAEWEIGDIIQVVASYSGEQSSPNETIATGSYMHYQNATAFEFEIPQFGSTLGLFVAAGLIGVVALTALFWKRK